jgi:hypothetical protein
MREKIDVEYQKTYVPDAKVKLLRDAGVTNFSRFVRECVDKELKARGIAAKQTPGTTTPFGGQSECRP